MLPASSLNLQSNFQNNDEIEFRYSVQDYIN